MSLDLDKDLPVTEEDVEVLRRLRYRDSITFEEYIDSLEELWRLDNIPSKKVVAYDEEFEL